MKTKKKSKTIIKIIDIENFWRSGENLVVKIQNPARDEKKKRFQRKEEMRKNTREEIKTQLKCK